MIITLRLLFSAIMPLVLSALGIISIPFIIKIDAMLMDIVGEPIMSIIRGLFLVLCFLIEFLLLIRKANNSVGKYDWLFKFFATNRLSIVIYSLIVLISLGLVYCCVCVCDLNVVGCVCVCDLNVVGCVCVCDLNVVGCVCVCDLNVLGLFAPSF
jgi:hypothetical protein